MNPASINTVGVVGGGQMGNGIAHVAAASDLTVVLVDLEEGLLAKARDAPLCVPHFLRPRTMAP